MILHLLNTSLVVKRPTLTSDGMGGYVETLTTVATESAKVDQATANERQVAAQWQSAHTHNVYFAPTANVRRGDELLWGDRTFRVLATVQPSRPVYLKAECEFVQREGIA